MRKEDIRQALEVSPAPTDVYSIGSVDLPVTPQPKSRRTKWALNSRGAGSTRPAHPDLITDVDEENNPAAGSAERPYGLTVDSDADNNHDECYDVFDHSPVDEHGFPLKPVVMEEHREGNRLVEKRLSIAKWLDDYIWANKSALDQKMLRVHPSADGEPNGVGHSWGDETSRMGANSAQSMASVAQTITFIGRVSRRTGKKEPDEFLQRLNFGAPVETKEPKPISTKMRGWNWVVNFLSSFVFDPFSDMYYYWLSLISMAVLYNFIIIPVRIALEELDQGVYFQMWLCLDIMADILYVLDFFASFRIGFLQRGLLVKDTTALSKKYMKSAIFFLDAINIIPTQIVYLIPFFKNHTWAGPAVRMVKLLRIHRVVKFNDRTECRTNSPTAWRLSVLFFLMLLVMHWNACLFFFISILVGDSRSTFLYPPTVDSNKEPNAYSATAMKYAYSLYWSTQTMTTIGEVNQPTTIMEYVYLTFIFLIGVMIFASVVGSIGNIITNLRANRNVFQDRLDHLKEYMGYRNVGKDLQNRIIRWFDYLWAQNHTFEEEDVLKYLPDKLQAEMAIHVHLATLKQVELFQNCESGFLIALVLKLKHQVYSPGDFVCRKGDIGREMFIVKQGMLQVTADDGRALATLSDGSYFGEISLLNVGKSGNRRTANVRSVGYSDLFCLRKEDLLHALNDYPEMREVLKEAAKKKLSLNNQSPRPEPETEGGRSRVESGYSLPSPEDSPLSFDELCFCDDEFVEDYMAARKKLARDAKPSGNSASPVSDSERRISFTNSVELADTLGKRLEDLEKLVLTLASELKSANNNVMSLQRQITRVFPKSVEPSAVVMADDCSSSSDDENHSHS